MFTINWTKKALKQAAKLPAADRGKVSVAVGTLVDLPAAKNVKVLTNHSHGYRLRVGNYRVLFDADTEIRIIEVQEVLKRDDNTY